MCSGLVIKAAEFIGHVIAVRWSTVTPASCRWCEGKGIDKLA